MASTKGAIVTTVGTITTAGPTGASMTGTTDGRVVGTETSEVETTTGRTGCFASSTTTSSTTGAATCCLG